MGRIFETGPDDAVERVRQGDAPETSLGQLEAAFDCPPRGCWDPLLLIAPSVSPAAPGPGSAVSQLEPMLTEALRSIAWGGDRRRGVARLQLGGRYDGASIRVDANDGHLSIELDAPPGVDAAALAERLGQRLRARGLDVDSLTVR